MKSTINKNSIEIKVLYSKKTNMRQLRMINLILFGIVILFTISCRNDENCHDSISIVNNSDEAIYFDMQDWYKVLRLSYIGETDQDEAKFKKMLEAYGVKNESDVILTNFYPQLKREVQESWKRLFKHHENIKQGRNDGDINIQAALWQIKKEWINTL